MRNVFGCKYQKANLQRCNRVGDYRSHTKRDVGPVNCQDWFPPLTVLLTTNLQFPWLYPILVTSSRASDMLPVSGVEVRRREFLVSLFPFIHKAKALLPVASLWTLLLCHCVNCYMATTC